MVRTEAREGLVAAVAVEDDAVALGRRTQDAVLRVRTGRDERLLLGAHEVAEVLLELRRRRLDAVLPHPLAERRDDGVDVLALVVARAGVDRGPRVLHAVGGRPTRLVLDDVEQRRDGGGVEATGQGRADAARRGRAAPHGRGEERAELGGDRRGVGPGSAPEGREPPRAAACRDDAPARPAGRRRG